MKGKYGLAGPQLNLGPIKFMIILLKDFGPAQSAQILKILTELKILIWCKNRKI